MTRSVGKPASPATAKARKPQKARQTQPERRDAMRKRILEATLWCLGRYGYAGTGVAQVTARAKVSRGAWSHHFPSMNVLIVEAAEHLLARVYERLGTVMMKVALDQDPVQALVRVVWKEFFASDVNEIYLELLIASRRNPELARKLRSLANSLENRLGGASGGFFESAPGGAASVTDMLHFNRWVMRGMALDAPLMPEGGVERALDGLGRIVAAQIRRKQGQPPGR